MNIFHQKFSAGQTVAATGVPNATLQSWMKRGFIVGSRESGESVVGGGTPGAHRLFSFFNVMEIAVAKGLLDAGLGDLDAAFRAARCFAHIGRGSGPRHQPARVPSCPFNIVSMSARTLLFVRGDWAEDILWEVGHDVLPYILHDIKGCVFIEVDSIFDSVVASLGYHPNEVLDLAYNRK